jgi:hypothetical protein
MSWSAQRRAKPSKVPLVLQVSHHHRITGEFLNIAKENFMKNRKSLIAITLISLLATGTAYAQSAATPTQNEAGPAVEKSISTKSRAEVAREEADFRKSRVSKDGTMRYAGKELGWVPLEHGYKVVNGKITHSDNLKHNAEKPSVKMTDAEKRKQKEVYVPN